MTGEQRNDVASAAPSVPTQRAGADPLRALVAAELGYVPRATAVLADARATVPSASLEAVYCAEDAFPRQAADGLLEGFTRTAFDALRPGGVFVVPVPVFGPHRPVSSPPRVVHRQGRRELLVSVWNWSDDGRSYTIEVLRLASGVAGWEVLDSSATRHRVLDVREVRGVLFAAGFGNVHRVDPPVSGHPVPLWVGTRP